MRRAPAAASGWSSVPGWPAIGLPVVALGVPLVGAIRAMTAAPHAGAKMATGFDGALLARTLGVALTIGVLASMLALPVAWAMRSLRGWWVAMLMAPLLLPSYMVYAAWGTLRGPGTPGGDWVARHADGSLLKAIDTTQAMLGLALWAWPLAAVVMGTAARRIDRETLDALRLSGAGGLRRGVTVVSLMRGAIVASVGLIALLMLGSAIPLHVARVMTYSIVVWQALDETAGSAAAWWAALPLVLPAVIAGWMIGGRVLARGSSTAMVGEESARVGNGWRFAAAGVWMLAAVLPLVLLVVALRHTESLTGFFTTLGEPLVTSARTGGIVAVIGLVIAASTGYALSGEARSLLHRGARLAVRGWLIAALVPGLLVGSGVLSASRLPWMGWLGSGDAGVVVAHVARFGAIAALAGWWSVRTEPRELADVRRMAPGVVRAWLAGPGLMHAGLLAGSALVIGLLSLHEIEATVVASPPRPITEGGTLAESMLRLLHFNRDEELTAACIVLMVGGLIAGFATLLIGGLSRHGRRLARHVAPVVLLAVIVGIGGCKKAPAGQPSELKVSAEFGEPGRAAGQFVVPRAVDTDGQTLWIVDKSGKVQHFDPAGKYLGRFALDRHDRGFPCGITVGPDGLLYVADTHENRVSVWRPSDDGGAVMIDEWGSYGQGPGQFIYPTDVLVVAGADGHTPERFYVSEYGGNDRINVFGAKHEFLFAFGHEGMGDTAEDVQFRRPQSMALDAARGELVVTDAVNHRVGRFTKEGKLIAWMGRAGAAPGTALGEFAYPYGLVLLEDGRALVSEYGNNRVQLIEVQAGKGIEAYGRSGRERGTLASPWAITVLNQTVYVLDTGNNRVQGFRSPGRELARMAGGAPG